MSLFRKIFRGTSGGGSGGPTTADKVSMTPVPGVNATDVQAGMSVIGNALNELKIEWDLMADYPAGNTTGIGVIAYNLGALPNGKYEFFISSNYSEGNGVFLGKITGFIQISIENNTIVGINSFLLDNNTTPGSGFRILETNIGYISLRKTLEGDVVLRGEGAYYGGSLGNHSEPIHNAFRLSKIKNIDTGETVSAKEIRVFDDYSKFDEYAPNAVGNLMSYPYVAEIYLPDSAIRYIARVPVDGGYCYILNYISDSNYGVVRISCRQPNTENVFSVEITKIADKYYKTIVKDTIGCDIAIYNSPDGQTVPGISGLVAGDLYEIEMSYYGYSAYQPTLLLEINTIGTKVADIPVFGGQSPILKTTDITADNIGTIVQYTGETKDGFVNGYFYKATGTENVVPDKVEITNITQWNGQPTTATVEILDIAAYVRHCATYVMDKTQVLDWGYDWENTPYNLMFRSVGALLENDTFTINQNGETQQIYFNAQYTAGSSSIENPAWQRIDVQTPGINNDASLYTLTSLSSMFQYSTAKLAKVYNEENLPTTGAYTVLSLGWTYNDSNNMPALLAVELATGKFYYYHGTEENCKPSAWKEFNFGTGGGSSTDNNGLEGDYCARYGIVDETQSGLPIQGTGNQVIVPAQLVMDIPGVPGLTINSSQITHDLTSTTNCELFLANGNIIEATDVFFQQEEPEDGNTGFAAWWNGTEWKFKSNDTGNVFRPANAVRIAKCIFTDGNLTRLCFTGCRLLNKQEWLPVSGGRLTGTITTNPVNNTSNEQILFTHTGIGGVNYSLTATTSGFRILGQLVCGGNVIPYDDNEYNFGGPNRWKNVFTAKLNNGEDINVPTYGGTLGVISNDRFYVSEDGKMSENYIGGDGISINFCIYDTIKLSVNQDGVEPGGDNYVPLGGPNYRWQSVYTCKINNGADIDVPTTGGTMVVAVPPAEEGTFTLKATRAADGTITTTWVKDA